jgi:type VI secretion system FHA domain protein
MDSLGEDPLHADVDPLNFFKPVGDSAARNRRPEPPVVDPLGQHYQPPQFVQPPPPAPATPPEAAAVIPDGYNPLMDEPPAMPPPIAPREPVIRPRPAGGDSAIVRTKRQSPKSDSRRARIPLPSSAPASDAEPEPPPAPVVPAAPPPVEDHDETQPPVIPPPMELAPPAPPPAVRQAPVATPESQPLSERPSPSWRDAATPDHPPSSPPRAAAGSDLAALLAGAGLPDAAATPELTRTLGEILRVVVVGLMDVLQSRQRIKEEFRMQQTIFRPSDNNPLKFSVNVEDALHNLLVKRNPAYLKPVEAFADAFDDLRDHQLAMLAGMRVAFETMLAEFDADKMQQEFDTQLGKSSLALVPAKLRYWDLFRARRAGLAKDPEEAFERLFGQEFRRAYEDPFRQLKAQRRTRGTPADPEHG